MTREETNNNPRLRFREFKASWETKQIGEILSIGNGKDYKHLKPGNIPVFGTGGYMTSVSKPIFKGESVFIGRKGSIDKPFYYDGEFWTVDTLFYTYNFRESIPMFVYNIFQKINWQKHNEATGVPSLSKGTIRKVKVNLPSLPEQQKIASFLSAVDDKIMQLTRKKELLEHYKKGVMQKIFKQEIRFKDVEGKDFPEWTELKLSKFLIPVSRLIKTPESNYLAIGIRSHGKGTFQKPDSDPASIAMENLFLVKENDLIVNITFAWEGAIAIVKKEDEGGLVSHRFPTFIFKEDLIIPDFFRYIIVQKRLRYILGIISPGGAGRNRVLNKKDFFKIKMRFPGVKEQQKISCFLNSLDKKIEQVTAQLEKMRVFKKGLLQQMFV